TQRHGAVGIFAAGRKIPVGGGGVESGALIGIVFFDATFKRMLEWHVIADVPTVDRDMAFAITVVVSLVVIGVLKQRRIAPGITEVVFRAGADSGRELFVVHEEFFVTFAPPTAARIPDVKHDADEAASALSFEDGPIDAALGFAGEKGIAMPFGVEPGQFGGVTGEGPGSDLVFQFDGQFALLLECDFGAFDERHEPIAIPPAIVGQAERQGAIII